jgi:serine-type D-Ala-D-Ala carboxypeptidase/endopeptidase (penicillin-binding protein 4)
MTLGRTIHRPSYIIFVSLSFLLPTTRAECQSNVPISSRSVALPRLQSLVQKGALVSAMAVNLRTGDVLTELKSNDRLTPASVTKVILAAAALEKFGSDHTLFTQMFRTGAFQNGRVTGDIVIVGAGDPYLTNEKLWFLATDVARAGVKEISGNLILNTSLFGKVTKDKNRRAGEKSSHNAYDAPLSAGAVNFSVMAAVVSPSQQLGTAAKVGLEPYSLDNIELSGQATTGKNTQLSATRTDLGAKERLTVGGSIAQGGFAARVYRSVSDADMYAAYVYKAFLEKAGVRVLGKVKIDEGKIDSQQKRGLVPLAQVEGFSLDWQLKGLLKMSNNFVADMWTLQLDPKISGQAKITLGTSGHAGGTLEGGAQELESYLKKSIAESRFRSEKSTAGLVLKSGSGLTPENRISARDIVTVLDRMFQNHREFPSFLSALPIPGAEGTVKKRFSEPNERHLRSEIRAKTGTLTEPKDAVGFAGYGRTKDNDWVAFAILVNGTASQPSVEVTAIHDAMDADLAMMFPASPQFANSDGGGD